MRYPVAVETGDESRAYGVVVLDLPGCFSAGDTLDEAFAAAEEAVAAWIDAALDNTVDRVNISLPRRVLARLDALAKAKGETRSGYIAQMTLTQYDVG